MRVLTALALVLIAAACGSSGAHAQSGGPLKVVAAENFWGNVAAQLGGPRVRVRSIISDPATDPHLYESDARDAAAVSDARLVIENGAGYDDFIGKLASGSKKVLNIADAVDARGSDVNPHLWYDVVNVRIAAQAILVRLETIDPAYKDAYEANYRAFYNGLVPVLDTIDAIKAKYAHTPVAYTERVPQYLLDNAGLDVRTPTRFAQAIEDGTEPSAGDTHAFDQLIDHHEIKLLIYNAQASTRVTNDVRARAKSAGIPVVAVTETLPKNEPSYQQWQLHQVQAILSALGG
jgi:zinc/manganese transport system substrate-binding protein